MDIKNSAGEVIGVWDGTKIHPLEGFEDTEFTTTRNFNYTLTLWIAGRKYVYDLETNQLTDTGETRTKAT